MAYRPRRGKLVSRPKRMNIRPSDIPNMCDAFFEGDHSEGRQGWVMMAANPKGRECINRLFPEAHIDWRDAGATPRLPADWLGFNINLPDTIAATATKLPLEITHGDDLDVANPDALAFLLATGVNRQGGRSAIWRDGQMHFFEPPAN